MAYMTLDSRFAFLLLLLCICDIWAQQVPFQTAVSALHEDELIDVACSASWSSDPRDASFLLNELQKSSWNGLTTFARAEPLRCLGADQEAKYDVAVLGICIILGVYSSLTIIIFDRSTL